MFAFFRKSDWPTMLRCAPGFLSAGKLPEKIVQRFRAASFELSGDTLAAFELDGEWAGNLPATFSIGRGRLRLSVEIKLVGWPGLEPGTNALKGHCSTN